MSGFIFRSDGPRAAINRGGKAFLNGQDGRILTRFGGRRKAQCGAARRSPAGSQPARTRFASELQPRGGASRLKLPGEQEITAPTIVLTSASLKTPLHCLKVAVKPK